MKMEKRDRQGVTVRRRFRSASPSCKWFRHAVSGVHGNRAEDLGKAFFKSTAAVRPETHESLADNKRASDFCERHGSFHQTARKLTVGAPRQEKTDTLKSYSENTCDKDASCPENMTEEESSFDGNATEEDKSCYINATEEDKSCCINATEEDKSCYINATEEKVSCSENLSGEKMSCPENVTEEEMLCLEKLTEKEMSCLENTTEEKMCLEILPETEVSCLKNMGEKGMSIVEKMTEKEMFCFESAVLKDNISTNSTPPPDDTPQDKARLKLALTVDHIYQDMSPEEEPKEEPKAHQSGRMCDVDNKLQEELEALPIPEHLKNQIRTLACTTETDLANALLKDFLEFWSIVNEISQAAKATQPGVSDQMAEKMGALLVKLFSAKADYSTEEEKKAMEESKSLVENVCRKDQPMDKWDAIGAAFILSQQNKLTNTNLTQIYSCLREQQPQSVENNAACSKELKSLLSCMEQEGSLDWKSLKESSLSKSPVPDKKAEDSDRSSLRSEIASPWHMGELSVEGEQGRSPVENSFYFSTFASSCITHPYLSQTPDIGCVSGRGTDLKIFLSLIRKIVGQVGGGSASKEQTVNSQGDKEKHADQQMNKQKDVNGHTEEGKDDQDDQWNKQENVGFEEKNVTSASARKQANRTSSDTEEIQEKAGTEEESKIQLVTALEADPEIKEKSEYEESEKCKKAQSIMIEPCTGTETPAPTTCNNSVATDTNRQTTPAHLKCMADTSKSAKTQQRALKTGQRTWTKKTKDQAQLGTMDKNQKKKKNTGRNQKKKKKNTGRNQKKKKKNTGRNQKKKKKNTGRNQKKKKKNTGRNQKKKKKNRRSGPRKKQRGSQPERAHKTIETRENRWQTVKGRADEKAAYSTTKRMSQDASLLEQFHPQQEITVTAERVSVEVACSRSYTEAKQLDESGSLSPEEHLQGFSDHKRLSRDKQSSTTSRCSSEKARERPVMSNHGKKSREGPQIKEISSIKSVKSSQTSVVHPKTQNHLQEEYRWHPVQIQEPPDCRREREFELPIEQNWLDVQGEVVRAKRAGESPHGTSQGQGNGNGDSANSSSAGGAGGAQSWGGARPKTRNSGGGGSGGGSSGGDGDDRRPPTRNVPDSLPLSTDPGGRKVAPRRNHKYRKKQHGAISNEQLCHCLGQAGQGMDTLRQSSGAGELNRCMRLCLHDTRSVTSPTDDDLACCTCAILHSLLSHFSMAAHGEACDLCRQLFTLVHFHILDCQSSWTNEDEEEEEERVESARNVCRRIRTARMFAGGGAVTVTTVKMWTKVRKYLSAALGPVLLFDMGIESEVAAPMSISEEELGPYPSHGEVAPSDEPGRRSHDRDPVCFPDQVPADHPGGHLAVMPKATSGSKLSRRPSQRVVPQKTIPEEPGSPYPSPTPPEYPALGEGSDQAAAAADAPHFNLPSTFPRQAQTPEEEEDFMEYIRMFDRRQKEQQQAAALRNVTDDPYATQKTYGMKGTVSMPEMGDRFIQGEQTLSVEMHPVGTPGIGEVVYGTRHQLQLVVRNWRQERDRCKASGICQYQHREEGVILHIYKKQLKILHTRYQKHHQWERLVHLGNGVTGKCHLCIDRSSNFKFCCKKVHILHYEDQELDIWSELDHSHIVRFYGAIRHGEKIYMFAEFIDGGSLAALIKEQWLVGRRLSHWTSLNYFRQLLQVLTYLQTKGVLHEDIKADNLLLRDGTTEIVLADFGAAQQIPHDHTPPNRFPVGSPAHWSPEKAASEGHGFTSDLWASACVLIHMLSGSPPWITRFPDAAILNYIIWSKPPPLDDLPADVKESVRNLLACCLVKDKAIRPKAKQILSHHAFRLLDQASSFFSIAQHATVTNSATSPGAAASVSKAHLAASQPVQEAPQPVASQSVQAAPQPVQAEPQPVQAEPQAAPQPVQAEPQPVQAAPQSVLAVLQPAQEVAPCQQVVSQAPSHEPASSSHPKRDTGMRTGQEGSPSISTPGPWSSSPTEKTSPFSPQRPVLRVVEIPRQSRAAQRGADERSGPQSLPATSSLTQSQDTPQGQHPVHRKSDPAISVPFPTGDGGNKEPQPVRSPQRKMGQVALHLPSLETNGGGGAREGDITRQQQREVSDRAYDVREGLLPLQPTLWPELPSPIFSQTTHNTGLAPPGRAQSSAPSGAMGYGCHVGPEGQRFFPSTSEAAAVRVKSTLTVPAPVPVSQSEEGNLSESKGRELGVEQTQLSSYGTSLGSMETGPVRLQLEQDRGEGHTSGGQESGVASQQSDHQRVPVTRVTLNRTYGDALQLHVVPQGEQRHSTDVQAVSKNLPSSDRSTTVSTTALTSSIHSHQANISEAQHDTGPHLQVPTASQQRFMGRAERQPDVPTQYPVLPALLPEDIQVSGNRRGMACIATLLSMIPEGVEPVSPSGRTGSSGESCEGTMWNYIQDQFAMLHESNDELLQSLHQQSENRPRLELYAPSALTSEGGVKEEVCRQPPVMMLPRFELLQSSLSDSSTLRSTRITTSSEEYSGSSQFIPHIPEATESSSPSSQRPQDEPDYAFATSEAFGQPSASKQTGSQLKNGSVQSPVIAGYPDEEHISSGDMFGSGPSTNPGFQEVYQYRNQQQLQHQTSAQMTSYQLLSSPVVQPATTMSKSMSKKQPNLRLNVAKPTSSTMSRTASSLAQSREVHTAEPSSNSSQHGDDAFLLHPGVSPMTASPIFPAALSTSTPRQSEVRPRSRNESGSSASTPKSSTYDRQEQEWNNLQQQTPGMEDALLEDPMIACGSELSSTHHLSLLYESQGENSTSDQEANEVLSMLQESISNEKLGGHRLEFENEKGQFLFDMRVLGKNKGWKELATTFQSKIRDAGFHHFKVMQQDGSPVDHLTTYNPAITRVQIIEVSDELDDVFSVCWCDRHLV